ncbi:hypothetical protein INT47_000660 [Mucor saturninus]|uniref:Uncharacterized protein n=1 Tax=Mucor saturninus TaxID=64648 RepID=A0A8H7RN58_9FUNG|nr:hypothetical protein INT47_000660 [Mucor saturninus]
MGALLKEEKEVLQVKEEEEEEHISHVDQDDWFMGDVTMDRRLTSGQDYHYNKATFPVSNKLTTSSADYFLYFLTVEFISDVVLHNINRHALISSGPQQLLDPLYRIRRFLDAFNTTLAKDLTPGSGMPNLQKVPRKPHPIGQEFKTLADHDTYCIIQLDTICDHVERLFEIPGLTPRKWLAFCWSWIAFKHAGSQGDLLASSSVAMSKSDHNGHNIFACFFEVKKAKVLVSSCSSSIPSNVPHAYKLNNG